MRSIVRRSSRSSASARRAFTLVEVAIVVVIVGVLAVLAIAGYRRYTATARTAEATNLTGDIRAAQEAYKAEKGIYAAVSTSSSSYYPAANPGKFVTEWGGPCGTCAKPDDWRQLTVHPSAPVMFGYATLASIGATPAAPPEVTTNGATNVLATPGALKATDPVYITAAKGDTDADGTPCVIVSYSFSNQLVVQAAGE